MPKYNHFEETPAWQGAARLYNLVLDLFEEHASLFTGAFRNQLDRCALSVSNNIAEGFERMTTGGLLAFLDIARGSAGETESMMRVVHCRPRLAASRERMDAIRNQADELVRQLTAWMGSIEHGDVQGKRHLTRPQAQQRQRVVAATDFSRRFYETMEPEHPLYHTPEAKRARGAGG